MQRVSRLGSTSASAFWAENSIPSLEGRALHSSHSKFPSAYLPPAGGGHKVWLALPDSLLTAAFKVQGFH